MSLAGAISPLKQPPASCRIPVYDLILSGPLHGLLCNAHLAMAR